MNGTSDGTPKSRQNLLKVLIAFLIVLKVGFTIMFGMAVFDVLRYDPDGDQTFESPFGDDEVTVRVDYLSCPDVFYEGKCIFKYDGPGFNETVYWDVEWLSEDEIRLYVPGYRWTDQVYDIDIPR